MDMVEKLTEINRKRDNGEISKEEAEEMKYDLVLGIDDDKPVEFDKGCST